ncbi:hypothetical protein, partial [Priestia aryabhattai]|uniref:hypothetical protein n=1 Tax=Priestia aryabhattai TaxID=412384 RepID=UPI003D12304F
HAASVHPEPGSNSPKKCLTCSFKNKKLTLTFVALFSFQSSTAALERLFYINKLSFICQQLFNILFLMNCDCFPITHQRHLII